MYNASVYGAHVGLVRENSRSKRPLRYGIRLTDVKDSASLLCRRACTLSRTSESGEGDRLTAMERLVNLSAKASDDPVSGSMQNCVNASARSSGSDDLGAS